MRTEDIKKAAEKSYMDMVCCEDEYDRELYIDGFTDGARWHSENIWHSGEEKIIDFGTYLVEYEDGEYLQYKLAYCGGKDLGLLGDMKHKKITRWARLFDLLPIKLI